jgi:flavin-dependent dehydrogenase
MADRSSIISSDNQVAVGFVVGLDYRNPWLSPFEEMQRFKTHPRSGISRAAGASPMAPAR